MPIPGSLALNVGSTGDAPLSTIHGMGTLELSTAELTSKGGGPEIIRTINAQLKQDLPWYLTPSHSELAASLRDEWSRGAERATNAERILLEMSAQILAVLVLGEDPYLSIGAPPAEFHTISRMLEPRIAGLVSEPSNYYIWGEFEAGLDAIDDHRPTPDQIAIGHPMLARWVTFAFREPRNRT